MRNSINLKASNKKRHNRRPFFFHRRCLDNRTGSDRALFRSNRSRWNRKNSEAGSITDNLITTLSAVIISHLWMRRRRWSPPWNNLFVGTRILCTGCVFNNAISIGRRYYGIIRARNLYPKFDILPSARRNHWWKIPAFCVLIKSRAVVQQNTRFVRWIWFNRFGLFHGVCARIKRGMRG